MGYLSSGNPIVDAMGTINITGNIVPTIWYKTVLKENGKPYLLAVAILSDIVYWYRPTEVRDQNTGQITGWRKRFSEDILRQSYQYYADLFGESKKTVKTAIDRLEELQAVKRHFRTISHGDGLISNNVMYVELIPARVYELTYPEEELGMDRQTKPCPAGAGDKTGGRLPTKPGTLWKFSEGGVSQMGHRSLRIRVQVPPLRDIPSLPDGIHLCPKTEALIQRILQRIPTEITPSIHQRAMGWMESSADT